EASHDGTGRQRAPRRGAGVAARREGTRAIGGRRRDHPPLRAGHRADERCEGGGPRVERSRLSRAPPRRPLAAIAELGVTAIPDAPLVVVENGPTIHNVVVCTLCSCYPSGLLGLPPSWYKSPAYRARMVREPRAVLAEMGLVLPADVEVRVWDSSAEMRYMVLPERPAGTDAMSQDDLAALVTRDAMI